LTIIELEKFYVHFYGKNGNEVRGLFVSFVFMLLNIISAENTNKILTGLCWLCYARPKVSCRGNFSCCSENRHPVFQAFAFQEPFNSFVVKCGDELKYFLAQINQ